MKHILIAVLGRTPQVITETLYALGVDRGIPIEEVILLTTAEGRGAVEKMLLKKDSGRLYHLISDYPGAFRKLNVNGTNIIVVRDSHGELTDIRNLGDNERFVEMLMRFIREKCEEKGTVLHCSLAGGRKTMSVYLALALQFFGRPEDRLYHVLVSPARLENNPDFYYPPPVSKPVTLADGNRLSTKEASIDLVEVPYIRLRGRLGEYFGREDLSYDRMVRVAQEQLAQLQSLPELVLDTSKNVVYVGDGTITLRPYDFAVYRFYVERSALRSDGIDHDDYRSYFDGGGVNNFERSSSETIYRLTSRKIPDNWNVAEEWEKVQQAISRIRRCLSDLLPIDAMRQYYEITSVGPYGDKKYGVKLDKGRIRIIGDQG